MKLDKNYWNSRYESDNTGWDLGSASTPIKEFIDTSLNDKDLRILIPGAGNGHEAEYLHKLGFSNIYIVDISPMAIENFKDRIPDFPHDHLICGNFFDLNENFDLVIEQTFFCALEPDFRKDYVSKMAEILNNGGSIVGLLFDCDFDGGPPFGGSRVEYKQLFEKHFVIKTMERANNSIEPRSGRELWIHCVREIDI